MPRGVSTDLENFKETLEKGVILVGGEAVDNNSIDPEDDTPVSVAIMFDVNGFGPHVGVICAVQGGHVDEALQAADELLEEWTLDHYPDSDPEHFTETFDGLMWELSPEDFIAAIKGTPAEKFIDVVEYEEEEDGAGEVSEAAEGDDEDVPLIRISFTRITRGDSEDSDDYEEEHGWIDEDGVEFEPDDDDEDPSDSIVRQAVDFLKKEGATNPSSSGFHSGIWYSTEYETTDYGTGEEEERSFHLKNFEKEEEAEIFKQMTARRR